MPKRPAWLQLLANRYWWAKESSQDAADGLWLFIERNHQRRRSLAVIDSVHQAIYEDRPVGETPNMAMQRLRQRRSAPATLNVTGAMTDTVVSRLVRRRPMPIIGADDAGWSEKLFARRASRVMRRIMGGTRMESTRPLVVRDMAVRGTGATQVCRSKGDVAFERFPRSEIVYDPDDGFYGAPKTMARHCWKPLEEMIARYPQHAQAIESAATRRPEYVGDRDISTNFGNKTEDWVEVAYGWHLPMTLADDPDKPVGGRAIVAVRNQVLSDEPWTRTRHPISLMHWEIPFSGLDGTGLIEGLAGCQAKVNDIAQDLQEALYFGSSLKVMLQRNANVNKHHLRARHPVVIEYDGSVPPQYVAPNPVAPTVIQFLDWLIGKMHDIGGISQLSTGSKNPLGANASGKALDTMYDIESDRFAFIELLCSIASCDTGRCMIDEAKAIAADTPKADQAEWIQEIDWRKAVIDGGPYHLSIEPTNFLPETRAGKLAFVTEMMEKGLIKDPSVIAGLFEEPDIAGIFKIVRGPRRSIERTAEDLADLDVEFPMPDPMQPLELGIEWMKAEYNDAWANRAPDEVLGRYRDWVRLAKAELDKGKSALAAMQQPAPAGPPMPGVGPPGRLGPGGPQMPGLTPTPDLGSLGGAA